MIIRLPLYECRIHFELLEKNGDIDVRQRRIFKKHKIKDSSSKEDDGCNNGLCIPCFTDYYIMVSKEGAMSNTILHELSHVVDFITQDRGIDDTESRAYLMGYLGETILEKVYELEVRK